MDTERLLMMPEVINIPRVCEKCGGVMVFQGLGEYKCEKCGELAFDDYGKVRTYIESHRGANAAEIESAVGVSQKSIRQLLREGRLEIAEGSKSFLRCELCGNSIRSGRFCPECEIKVHRNLEAKQREQQQRDMQGTSINQKSDEGHKRFTRN